MKKVIQIGLVTGVILSAGCATMESRIEASPQLYPATRMDLSAFRGPFNQNDVPKWMPFAMLPVAILDMPFSLVSDTLESTEFSASATRSFGGEFGAQL